jgi:hypothetical protein
MRFTVSLLSLIFVNYVTAAPMGNATLASRQDCAGCDGGNFYLYTCQDCGCEADYAYNNFEYSGCLNVGGQHSVGLTATTYLLGFAPATKTSCSLYSEQDCQGDYQSVGVRDDKQWSCTNSYNTIQSLQCYYHP